MRNPYKHIECGEPRKSIPDATGVSPEETCTVVQVKSFGKYFCFGLVWLSTVESKDLPYLTQAQQLR